MERRRNVEDLRCQFDKVFVPDPADLVCHVVLIFGQPELTLFTKHVKDLVIAMLAVFLQNRDFNSPRRQHRLDKGDPPLSLLDQY